MNEILKLLLEGESLSTHRMAEVLGISEADVEKKLEELKDANILLGWRPILHPKTEEETGVRAVIEVKITPERNGGFNRLADRISRFDEVESCYLMSGGYDLLVFVRGPTLQSVAAFVSERLATMEGVVSTATHFMLRSYKEQGFLLNGEGRDKVRPDIMP